MSITQTVITKEEFIREFDYSLRQQMRGDVAMTFIFRIEQFSWFDNNTMKTQMKMWRKLAKEGKIIMRTCNNKNFNYKGKEYYLLEVQKIEEDPTCLIGLFIAKLLVNGCGYVFLTESSRDKVVEYVMKGIVVTEDEF